MADTTQFYGHALGHLAVHAQDDGSVRMRAMPAHQHSNILGNVHGGAILALIDAGLFAGAALALRPEVVGSVTLDLSTQFIGSAQVGRPLDVVTQVLKETGRLIFVRGMVEQGDQLVASFSATLRKPSRT